MSYRSVIRNFRYCNADQAKRLKNELTLGMSDEVLSYCIAHYKNHELRDPYIDELLMLDRLCAALERAPDAVAPTDLFTRDDFAAETYADMMAKRRQTNPDAKHPCTMSEAAKLASIYMLRAGKSASVLRSASVIPESVRDRQAFPSESCLIAPNSAFRLRVLPFTTAKPEVGDLLLLLSPGETQTRLSFYKATERLLETPTVATLLKGVYTVRRTGLLRELLEITNSLRLVLTPFSNLHTPMPLTILNDHHEGCRILRIRADAKEKLMQLIHKAEISASLFGEITSDGRFTFYRGDEESFSIHPQFLRTLYRYKGVPLKLATETTLPIDEIRHRTVAPFHCQYLSPEITNRLREAVSINGVLAASASATPQKSYCKTALYTALSPILTLAASGVPYSDQVLSLGVEMPEGYDTPSVAGEGMSVLLGLYRAQAELGIPAQAISLRTESAVKHPTVTAFALAEGSTPVSSCFTAPEHEVYCLVPKFHRDGTPHFQSLRKMMDEVTSLQKSGQIASMRVIVNESVTDVLSKMNHTIFCSLTELSIASDGPIPLGILIEAAQNLPYPPIGITRAKQESESTPSPIDDVVKPSLIWSDLPEIVILAKKTDADAQTLTALFEGRGAHVHLFYADAITDGNRLSRAILGAQTLILCNGASLPQDEKIDFALAVMKQANGILVNFSPSTVSENGFLTLSGGLDSAFLEKICPDRKKNRKNS